MAAGKDTAGLTFGSLEACRACSYDLADAVGLPLDQAVCEVDHHCSSSHAVHQLDMLKGLLAVIPCAPVHTTQVTLEKGMARKLSLHRLLTVTVYAECASRDGA